jgi:hypothetical protein
MVSKKIPKTITRSTRRLHRWRNFLRVPAELSKLAKSGEATHQSETPLAKSRGTVHLDGER